MKRRFIFSCGDINGVGPEIVIKSLNRLKDRKGAQFVFICPGNVFKEVSSLIKPLFKYEIVSHINQVYLEGNILFDSGTYKMNTGKPTVSSGKASFTALEIAAELLKKNYADALITAPISKEALNSAGYNYPGHTEMLAEWFQTDNFVMMFLSRKVKAALTTIHRSLAEVPALITKAKLESTANVIINSLKKDFKIISPLIGVLGLNPHAGESGLIGKEEEKILKPFINDLRYWKYLKGPFSPDAYWGNKTYENFDLTLGMYHDQVLIPFKLMNFSKGVNYTAGLPIVRTSPDHGAAFDISGKGIADENSTLKAFLFAELIAKNRRI